MIKADHPIKPDYRRAFLSVGPVFLSLIPLSMLFGALAVDTGMTVPEAVFFSAIVFAGASQMVGIELFGQDIPAWLVVFSIFAVNFRHILYSASIGPKMQFNQPWKRYFASFLMVDPVYAMAENNLDEGRPIIFAEFIAAAIALYIPWVICTWIGASFGNLMEDRSQFGIDYLLPLYFMALVMGFRKRPLWLSVVVASGFVSYIVYITIGSPWHVSLGGLAGVLVGAFWGVPKANPLDDHTHG